MFFITTHSWLVVLFLCLRYIQRSLCGQPPIKSILPLILYANQRDCQPGTPDNSTKMSWMCSSRNIWLYIYILYVIYIIYIYIYMYILYIHYIYIFYTWYFLDCNHTQCHCPWIWHVASHVRNYLLEFPDCQNQVLSALQMVYIWLVYG